MLVIVRGSRVALAEASNLPVQPHFPWTMRGE